MRIQQVIYFEDRWKALWMSRKRLICPANQVYQKAIREFKVKWILPSFNGSTGISIDGEKGAWVFSPMLAKSSRPSQFDGREKNIRDKRNETDGIYSLYQRNTMRSWCMPCWFYSKGSRRRISIHAFCGESTVEDLANYKRWDWCLVFEWFQQKKSWKNYSKKRTCIIRHCGATARLFLST